MIDDPELLDALYLGATDTAAFQQAIVTLAAQFGCVSSALVSLDQEIPETNMIMSTGAIDENAGRRYVEHFGAIDPAPAAFARLPVGRASTTDRLMPRELMKSEFVQDFYFPLGLRETLGGNLISDGGRFALIGLHRGADREAFTDDEIAALERLIPHVTRTLQLRRAFMRVHAQATSMQSLLDRSAAGIALMDSVEGALFVNRALRDISARHDGLVLDARGRPMAASVAAQQRLDALIADAIAGGPGGLLSILRAEATQPYAVLVSTAPSTFKHQEWERRGRASAIVLVHDPDQRPRNAADVLREGLGLTVGAARLVAALAADEDLQSFSEREGVTIHTARFHLRTALTRTGTRSQASLVRAAVRLLRDLSLNDSDG
ncbi:MAG: hypothetical protein ACXWJW_09885 [Xanthobacteraceae bacterium]